MKDYETITFPTTALITVKVQRDVFGHPGNGAIERMVENGVIVGVSQALNRSGMYTNVSVATNCLAADGGASDV